MTKYEWTQKQVELVTAEHPPENPKYIDKFLGEISKEGQALTRVKFFEIYDRCGPAQGDEADYFDYGVLVDHWAYSANFSEAWDIAEPILYPQVNMVAATGDGVELPGDFCSLGGTPDWIQSENYPICPECDNNMSLFIQLKSLPYETTEKNESLNAYTFGDAGNFHLFTCPQCGTFKASSEGY